MTEITVHGLLRRAANEWPDRVFLRFAGSDLTFADVDRLSDQLARGFAHIGAAPGNLVASLVSNRSEACLTWFALNKLGSAYVPINTAFRGDGLAHAINLSGSKVLVVDDHLVTVVADIWPAIEHRPLIVVIGGAADPKALPDDAQVFELDNVMSMGLEASSALEPGMAAQGSDLAIILFTSGTTGRSKACALSHRFAVRHGQLLNENLRLREDDVLYSPFPLFHADAAIFTVMPALAMGATAAIGERFTASGFWDEVRTFGATVFDFMGGTLTLLNKQPLRADDANNPVRLAWGVPLPTFAAEFEGRFGLQLTEVYGLTDTGIVLYNPIDEPRRTSSCGRAIDAFEVEILDGAGHVAPIGTVGEIAVRPREPDLVMHGYYGMPEATAAAFRGLWFHTGDLARKDKDGFFYFVGRTKDVIRRFGENISAFEVEEVAKSHPAVLDAAAFGVPSELSEDELMLAVVLRPEASAVRPAEIAAHFEGRIARYAVPRYIEVLDQLPRTPTEKVEKHVLVARGVTAGTWDRRAAGAAERNKHQRPPRPLLHADSPQPPATRR